MKKDKEKEKYESPFTKKTQVNLESGFMTGSANVQNPDENNGRIEKHQVNQDFGFTFEDGNAWDSQPGSNN